MEYIILNGKDKDSQSTMNYGIDPTCPTKTNVCMSFCLLGGGGGTPPDYSLQGLPGVNPLKGE